MRPGPTPWIRFENWPANLPCQKAGAPPNNPRTRPFTTACHHGNIPLGFRPAVCPALPPPPFVPAGTFCISPTFHPSRPPTKILTTSKWNELSSNGAFFFFACLCDFPRPPRPRTVANSRQPRNKLDGAPGGWVLFYRNSIVPPPPGDSFCCPPRESNQGTT